MPRASLTNRLGEKQQLEMKYEALSTRCSHKRAPGRVHTGASLCGSMGDASQCHSTLRLFQVGSGRLSTRAARRPAAGFARCENAITSPVHGEKTRGTLSNALQGRVPAQDGSSVASL